MGLDVADVLAGGPADRHDRIDRSAHTQARLAAGPLRTLAVGTRQAGLAA